MENNGMPASKSWHLFYKPVYNDLAECYDRAREILIAEDGLERKRSLAKGVC